MSDATDPAPHPLRSDALAMHAGFVRRLASALLRDEAEADDAAQETLLRALETPPRRPPGGRAWLTTVLRNIVRRRHRDAARVQRRETAVARHDGSPAADDVAARQEILRSVVAAIDRLDMTSREVVLLRHFENLPPREIAVRLGIAVETVKRRLERAHERLRALLDEGRRGNVAGWRSALCVLVGFERPGGFAPAMPSVTKTVGGIAMTTAGKVGIGIAAAAILGVGGWLVVGRVKNDAPAPSRALSEAEPSAPDARQPESHPAALATSGRRAAANAAGAARTSDEPSAAAVPAASVSPTDAETARRGLVVQLNELHRLLTILGDAIAALVAGRMDEAAEHARAVLAAEPDNMKAAEVERAAQAALRHDLGADQIRTLSSDFQAWLDDMRRAPGIDERLLKWPSAAFWAKVAPLREAWNASKEKGGDTYLRSVVADARVSVAADDEPLVSVVGKLCTGTAIDIVLAGSAESRARTYTVRHLDLHEQTVAAALDAAIAGGDFTWSVAGGSVRIVARDDPDGTAGVRAVMRFYDVADLVASVADAQGSTESAEKPTRFASAEALASAVRAEVVPAGWAQGSGGFVSVGPGGRTLFVKATQEVQANVGAWLSKHRREPDRSGPAPARTSPVSPPAAAPQPGAAPPAGSPPPIPPTYTEPPMKAPAR